MPKKDQKEYPSYLALRVDDGFIGHIIITPDLLEIDKIISEQIDPQNDASPPSSEDEIIKEQIEESESELAKLIANFAESMNSVYHTINLSSFIRIHVRMGYGRSQLISFAEEQLAEIRKYGDYTVYGVPENALHDTNRRTKKFRDFSEGAESFPSIVMMGLVARFDAQISSFVRLLLKLNPKILSSNEREVDLSAILRFENIDELKDYIIDNEIHRLMYSSHDDQVKYIESTFSISIVDFFKNYPEFLEIFERRNLVAHGESKANERYINRCKLYKVPESVRLNLEQEVILNDKYLLSAADRLYEFGFLLFWWMWLKINKEEGELAYSLAISATFDLILEGRFDLASRIIASILSRKDNKISETHLRMLCVNRANCLKSMKDKKWRVELDRFKWDACTDNFKICIASLDEDLETVTQIMPGIASLNGNDDSKIGRDGFRNWPVFKWVKDDQKYRDKFKEVFGEDLDSKEIAGGKSDDAVEDASDGGE